MEYKKSPTRADTLARAKQKTILILYYRNEEMSNDY